VDKDNTFVKYVEKGRYSTRFKAVSFCDTPIATGGSFRGLLSQPKREMFDGDIVP